MSLRIIFLIITLSYHVIYATSTTPQTSPAQSNNQTGTVSNTPPAAMPLEFLNARARPSMFTGSASSKTNNNSAAFVTIRNNSNNDYTLINVSTDIAKTVEIHQSIEDKKSGVISMQPIDKLVIPAKSTVELKPGGTHLMLINLKHPLKIGEKFTLSLFFDGDITQQAIEVVVDNISSQ